VEKDNNQKEQHFLLQIIKDVIGSSPLCHIEIFPLSTPADYPQAIQSAAEAARSTGKSYFLTINLRDSIGEKGISKKEKEWCLTFVFVQNFKIDFRKDFLVGG
jgi:sugar/nucleoside kinase (ribokinase family)